MDSRRRIDMAEILKWLCALILITAAIVTPFAWYADQPDQTVWILRIGAPLVGTVALAILIAIYSRADVVPDYLHQTTGSYFNRGGFCFSMVPAVVDEVCVFQAFFQNQYERPCVGRIILRPYFTSGISLPELLFDVICEEGAFGVVTLPVGLPHEVQGCKATYRVGASVKYPDGRGKRLRFRDGLSLREDAKFRDRLGTTLTVLGALVGHIVISTPAKITVMLPEDVVEVLLTTPVAERQLLWKLGDPPLE